MIGRRIVLFDRTYEWELHALGLRNEGTPMVETITQWRLSGADPCTDCGHSHGDAMCNATIPTLRGGIEDEYACNCTGPHPDGDGSWTGHPADYEPEF